MGNMMCVGIPGATMGMTGGCRGYDEAIKADHFAQFENTGMIGGC